MCIPPIVSKHRLGKINPSFSLLGNGSKKKKRYRSNEFKGSNRIVGRVIFYPVRVVWKGSSELVFPITCCCVLYVLWVVIILWCGYVRCTVLHKGDGLRLTICACYLWEMTLNLCLRVSFDNMQDWKGIREKAKKVSNTKAYITNDKNSRWIVTGVTLVLLKPAEMRHTAGRKLVPYSTKFTICNGILLEIKKKGLFFPGRGGGGRQTANRTQNHGNDIWCELSEETKRGKPIWPRRSVSVLNCHVFVVVTTSDTKLSRVRGSVTKNNGSGIGWLDLLALDTWLESHAEDEILRGFA
jgi:hypothetical protein